MGYKSDFNRILISSAIRTFMISLMTIRIGSFSNSILIYIMFYTLANMFTYSPIYNTSYPVSIYELLSNFNTKTKELKFLINWDNREDYLFLLGKANVNEVEFIKEMKSIKLHLINVDKLTEQYPKLRKTFELNDVYKSYLILLWNSYLRDGANSDAGHYRYEDVIEDMRNIYNYLETYTKYMDIKNKNIVDSNKQFELKETIENTIYNISRYTEDREITNLGVFEDDLEYFILTEKYDYKPPVD